MTWYRKSILLLACLFLMAGSALAEVSFDPLPRQAFVLQESFDEAAPAGLNLSPTFVPYPQAPTWKVPNATEVVDGSLTSSNKNGAAQLDVSSLFGPTGVDLVNNSVALYMRLWCDASSTQPRISIGFMNAAAEAAAPVEGEAQYLGMYVRNSNNPMIGWGWKTDMDNQFDGTGLQKQGITTEGWRDYAVLLEGNGTSVSVSTFVKDINEGAWAAVPDNDGVTTVDTEKGFAAGSVFIWTRDKANVWKIDELAVSQSTGGFDSLRGQSFLHQETFIQADAPGFNLDPGFVPYPQAPTWKVPGASEVAAGALTSSNKNGAAMFDVSDIFGPNGVDLVNSSVALYMRLWCDVASNQPRVSIGFMNAAAEEPAPVEGEAQYLGMYVRNSNNPMIGWGWKTDMDNQFDGVGLQKQGIQPEGWYDYALLLEGNGTSVSARTFYKAIDDAAWTAFGNNQGVTTIDTGKGFASGKVFFWTRDKANIWKIDAFAVSEFSGYVIDDIESYNELEEDDPDSHRIYMVWADGYEDDNNGSQLGRVEDPLASPFTSHSLRRNGGQAMSLLYDNTVAEKSEVKAQITDLDNVNPDWTRNDATILTVWVYGAVGNTGSLYVTINGVKVADSAGTVDLAQPQWQPFIIDTAAVGTDTTVVMEIGIGIEGAAAKGNIYVDDIALGLP